MKKWLLGILAAIGGILAIILGIGKNKRVKEIKSKIKDNEKQVKDIDAKIKATKKQNEAIGKSLKSKKEALKEISLYILMYGKHASARACCLER